MSEVIKVFSTTMLPQEIVFKVVQVECTSYYSHGIQERLLPKGMMTMKHRRWSALNTYLGTGSMLSNVLYTG